MNGAQSHYGSMVESADYLLSANQVRGWLERPLVKFQSAFVFVLATQRKNAAGGRVNTNSPSNRSKADSRERMTKLVIRRA
jgi:hypothetical protein